MDESEILPEDDQVLSVVREVAPAQWQDSCLRVLSRFQQNPELFALPVVKGEEAVGLVGRHEMIETFSRPYTRELYRKKRIGEFLRRPAILIDKSSHLDQLVGRIAENQTHSCMEGFVVTDRGKYFGVGNLQDLLRKITHRKQEHLYRLAHFDHLTGLPNRLLFLDRLHQACALAERNGNKVGLIFLDLDGFKFINDSLGHAAGDYLLKQVGARLAAVIRRSDTLARLGGDEFTVVLNGIDHGRDAGWVADKLLQAVAEPVPYLGEDLYVTASIGIAIYPSDDRDLEQLVKKADMAMYQAKENGKHNYQFFSGHLNRRTMERIAIEKDLRKGLERDQFFLVYQPIFDAGQERIRYVETLLRWNHPERGLIGPGEFIKVAEESRLIDAIGEWVLRHLCAQLREWREAGRELVTFTVNISMRQFHDPGFCRLLKGILHEYGAPAGQLMLEVTEEAVMKNPRRVEETIRKLKEIGVKIAIDDFGTGYSSLSYLHKLPFDAIKIDSSFVWETGRCANSAKITAAIISLSHSLDLPVIAEGVETDGHLEFLRAHRCDFYQGYYFARPMGREALEGYLPRGEC